MKKLSVYLASQSPRRKEILKKLGIRFKEIKSNYQEKRIHGLSGKQLAIEHAAAKAWRTDVFSGIVLGADTVVCYKKKILGKPRTKKEAVQMLKLLSGRTHHVYTGLALWSPDLNRLLKAAEVTKVKIKKLSGPEIEAYIKAVHSYDKAGAYAIQMKPKIVAGISGSYTNVVGLPHELLKKMLKAFLTEKVK